ncbi:MAG: B12-binding domain-containing radical SAM protein [Spirochaetes bacterium]|nr:B12-binding domain-containing radical SAM protein [Spirochaetota bacterium]
MKKVLLVGVNARYTHSCLALYCLKSYTRGVGADIIIREYTINRSAEEIADEIAAEQPDAVALSVYIWNTALAQTMLPDLKKRLPECVFILGGPEVSYNPESWLADFPSIDYVIPGQGEAAFRRLVESGFRHDEKIIRLPAPPFADMPPPYDERDLDALANRYVYYESSRGCPYRCSYCLSSRADQKPESKSVDTVRNELIHILARGPKLVKFVDRTFNLDRERYRAIWRFLIEEYRDCSTTFHFEVHPARLDEDDFALLSRCPKGLFQLEIGVQSLNRDTLAAVRRSGEPEQFLPAISRLIRLGTIHVHLDLIAGLPFDGMESIGRAFNSLYALGPDHLQLGFLKVLPGTEMRERADEFGIAYAERATYQVCSTRWLAADEMRLLQRIAHLIDRLYNSGRFPITLSALAARYESPFDLYRDLAAETALPSSRRWEAGAEFLLGSAVSRFPDKKSFFLDALRWDWCAGMKTTRCPSVIRPANTAEIEKTGLRYFRDLAHDGTVRYREHVFTISDLDRAVFFRAETEEFAAKNMDGYRHAVFIPSREVILFD